jgi:hypothetical protein
MTPFQDIYGYEPSSWKDLSTRHINVASVKYHLDESQKILQLLKEKLTVSRDRLKKQADQNRTEREFEVEDWVFVRIKPYKQLSLKQHGNNKLAPKFYGPYQINRKFSHVAYRLDLPDKSCIHNVFHVSCLKIFFGKQKKAQTIILLLDEEGRIILDHEAIISTQEKRLCSQVTKEYLIKWENLPKEDASWESEHFHRLHPSLPLLRGQRKIQGKGNAIINK